MAEATPATAVPNARLSGTKKSPGNSSHAWDSYLHKVLQDNHPDVKITKEAMQVWAEALDAWLQQLAQEIVHEQTSRALTPANVQAFIYSSKNDDGPQKSSRLQAPHACHSLATLLVKCLHSGKQACTLTGTVEITASG